MLGLQGSARLPRSLGTFADRMGSGSGDCPQLEQDKAKHLPTETTALPQALGDGAHSAGRRAEWGQVGRAVGGPAPPLPGEHPVAGS